MVGAFRIGSVIRREVEREEAPLIFGTDDPRTWFVVLRVLLVALSAIVLPIALAKCRCRRLQWLPTEVLCSAYIPTAMLTLVATQRGNVALLASNSVWAAEYRDAGAQEAITMVSIGVGLGWSKLLRSDRLAAILLGTILAYILPMFAEGFSSEPFEEAGLLGLTFAFVGNTAHNLESFTRGEFRKGHQVVEQQTQLGTQSALASGMQAIAERLCDLVFALDSQLVVCEQATAVDSFFGRPMFGVCLTAVLDDRDMQRTRDAFREASQSMIPQCLCVTLSTGARRLCEARLLVTDTGNEPQRFIAGVSIDHEQHAELSEIGAELAPFARVERSMPIGDLETSSMGTAHIFETQPLDIIAELGRKEHWWIDMNRLRVPQPVRVLGQGSFGLVFVANINGQAVAVKTLRDESADKASQKSFLSELRVLRYVRHQHIVAFLGAAMDNDSLSLVYEMIVGTHLNTYVKLKPFEAFERVKVALQMCSALRYLHEHDPAIIHGDLKASNVLVDEGSTGACTKLIDFGLSRISNGRKQSSGGTFGWAAPELLLPLAHGTPAVDIYGFGWLLHLAIANELPFGGATGAELQEAMMSMMARRQPPPLEAPQACPFREQSAQLCARCLRFEAQERPGIKAVHTALESWAGLRAASDLGMSLTSTLLPQRAWCRGGKDSVAACLRDGDFAMVQIDLDLSGETSRVIYSDAPRLFVSPGPEEEAFEGLGDHFEDPEALDAILRSTLGDLRRGAMTLPLLQVVGGLRLRSGEGQMEVAKILFLNAGGSVSIRLMRQGTAQAAPTENMSL